MIFGSYLTKMTMKKIIVILLMMGTTFSFAQKQKNKVLVFSKTKGYRHGAIEVGKAAIQELGQKNNFDVDTTENAAVFTDENLKQYKAVIFLNTTGDVLDPIQENVFKNYIKAGNGYVGIHAAADTEYDWPWYGQLAGAYFKSHPKGLLEAKFVKKDKKSPLVKNLPDEWTRIDELYNYKNISDKINVLYALDESSYVGGENGDNHPIAWNQSYDGGRAFYTGMGHSKECYVDPLFLDHVLQGIKYAMGAKK